MSEGQRSERQELAPIERDENGLVLRTLEESYRFSKYIVSSGIAPKGDTPEAVLVKLQAGAELGFRPVRSLSALVVINGRLSMMGEAALALCRGSGVFHMLRVENEGSGDNRAGVVKFWRKDQEAPGEVRFTLADAKRARLVGKGGPWDLYTDDLLIWKAVSRFSKRYASDVLYGMDVAEVVPDIPAGDAPKMLANARVGDFSEPKPDVPDPLFTMAGQPIQEAEEPGLDDRSEEEYRALLDEESANEREED